MITAACCPMGDPGRHRPEPARCTGVIDDSDRHTGQVLRPYQVAPAVIGRDVDAWRALASLAAHGRHRQGGHIRLAVSAVELAAWDLRSHLAGVPVGVLLAGERRARVPVYATALGVDIDHPLAPDIARWLVGEGFWAQKWGLPGAVRGETPRADAVRLRRIRDAIGEEARICVDVGVRWSADYSRQMLIRRSSNCPVGRRGALYPGGCRRRDRRRDHRVD